MMKEWKNLEEKSDVLGETFLWNLSITRCDNGYILTGQDFNTVIEDGVDELLSHESLLWRVMEYFDFSGSKHDKERIRITREKH